MYRNLAAASGKAYFGLQAGASGAGGGSGRDMQWRPPGQHHFHFSRASAFEVDLPAFERVLRAALLVSAGRAGGGGLGCPPLDC